MQWNLLWQEQVHDSHPSTASSDELIPVPEKKDPSAFYGPISDSHIHRKPGADDDVPQDVPHEGPKVDHIQETTSTVQEVGFSWKFEPLAYKLATEQTNINDVLAVCLE